MTGDFFQQETDLQRSQIVIPDGKVWEEVPAVLAPGSASFHHCLTLPRQRTEHVRRPAAELRHPSAHGELRARRSQPTAGRPGRVHVVPRRPGDLPCGVRRVSAPGPSPMRLYGSDYTRSELLRRVGHLRQVAGIEPITLNHGHSRDVRILDVRTGSGLRFAPMIDRGFDVGYCEFKGASLAWISPNGFPDPRYYELKRRQLLAPRRPRRSLQHGRARRFRQSADHPDRSVRVRRARDGSLRNSRSHRRHACGVFRVRRGMARRHVRALGRGEGAPAVGVRREPVAHASLRGRVGCDVVPHPRRRRQRGVLPESAPDALPLQHRLPRARRRRGAGGRGRGRSAGDVVLGRRRAGSGSLPPLLGAPALATATRDT